MAERITEEELESCLEGGDQGLTRLVRRLQGIVHARVARVFLRCDPAAAPGKNEDIEEVAQGVFVTLFERDAVALRGWKPDRGMSLENYVGMIAERRAISALRRRRRAEVPLVVETLEAHQGALSDPARGAEPRVEHRQLLRRMLRRLEETLSPGAWRIFELRFIDELEIDEIHQETGLSPDAIYAAISRLRRQARGVKNEIEAGRRLVNPLPTGGRR